MKNMLSKQVGGRLERKSVYAETYKGSSVLGVHWCTRTRVGMKYARLRPTSNLIMKRWWGGRAKKKPEKAVFCMISIAYFRMGKQQFKFIFWDPYITTVGGCNNRVLLSYLVCLFQWHYYLWLYSNTSKSKCLGDLQSPLPNSLSLLVFLLSRQPAALAFICCRLYHR